MPPYFNAIDILCVPSQTTPRWREQFGRVIIEAFACGYRLLAATVVRFRSLSMKLA